MLGLAFFLESGPFLLEALALGLGGLLALAELEPLVGQAALEALPQTAPQSLDAPPPRLKLLALAVQGNLVRGQFLGLPRCLLVEVVALTLQGGTRRLHLVGKLKETLAFVFEMRSQLLLLLRQRALLLVQPRFVFQQRGLLSRNGGGLDAQCLLLGVPVQHRLHAGTLVELETATSSLSAAAGAELEKAAVAGRR